MSAQALHHAAPRRGFAVEVERPKQVPIDAHEKGLNAVIIAVMAVFAIIPGVGGVELGGGGGDLRRAAGQGRDPRIEGLHVGLQGFGGVPLRIHGHKQHLEASRLGA